jgi:iron complex transport system ATP-binding protein
MLIAHDIVVRRGGRALLDRVSLPVPCGSVTALLGANGAGKSTLLRALAGELACDAGRVTLDAQPLAQLHRTSRARRIAVLTQNAPPQPGWRVDELVALGRTPHGTSRDDPRLVRAALAQVGLSAFAARDMASLSGGEQQRVHLARCLVQLESEDTAPRFLLLDEPTASLDLAQQHRVLRLVRHFAQRGWGVLTILHDLHLAAAYADRLALLAGGRLLAHGTVRDVLQPALIEAAYGMRVRAAGPGDKIVLFVPTEAA